MGKKGLAAACTVGVAVGAAFTLGTAHSTASSGPRHEVTLLLTFDRHASHDTDVKPHGPSAGDTYVYSATIRRGGRVVGRLEGVTIAADDRYPGDVSTQYLALAGGTVAIVGGGQSGAPGVGRPDNRIYDSIVGGSGRYAGASGWVSAKDVRGGAEQMKLHFTG